MEKKAYIIPRSAVVAVTNAMPIALSNTVDGDSVNLKPGTMEDGDGSDAVKHRNEGIYDDHNGWKDGLW